MAPVAVALFPVIAGVKPVWLTTTRRSAETPERDQAAPLTQIPELPQ